MSVIMEELLTKPLTPSAQFDVRVCRIRLQDQPATLHIELEIAGTAFFSRLTYHSIPSWQALWERCDNPGLRPQLLGALVAWECMRFLALGGEKVILCEGLSCTPAVRRLWTECFHKQLGEWRYLNQVADTLPGYPQLVVQEECTPLHRRPSGQPAVRGLLTNGGGKDTLAGILLLNEAHIPFDLYEGYLPIGNNSIALQQTLLQRLKDGVAPSSTRTVAVTVEDNFFSCPDEQLQQMGVQAQHEKIDFAVGHTANYVGYFPLILYHQYTQVWFNIEKSADQTMVVWQGESINHQWCKSIEYQQKSTQLFAELTQVHWFRGFSSTLRGLYDMSIYALVAQHPDLLRLTHSCNYGKPWCNHCPKCCFCYLMMSAYLDEDFAKQVVGASASLFAAPENRTHWASLLDRDKVAWECVPSHEECQLAAWICLQKGVDYPVLHEFVQLDQAELEELWQTYTTIDWALVPAELQPVLAKRFAAIDSIFKPGTARHAAVHTPPAAYETRPRRNPKFAESLASLENVGLVSAH
jgi:UDP-N-acetyl-alpha-D-muramoyl-L-alanyl-L-glutamate epimerase